MNSYELTVIIDGKATPAKKKAFLGRVSKLIKLFKGEITKEDDWGKRDLAYKINKLASGNYLFFELKLEGSAAKSLRDKLRVDEDVVRYLLLRVSK